MQILIKEPGKAAVVRSVPERPDCREYKNIIGGEVSGVFHPSIAGVYIMCRDTGKLIGLEPNFYIPEYNDLTVGTVVFLGTERGGEYGELDFASLSGVQISELLYYLEKNVYTGG